MGSNTSLVFGKEDIFKLLSSVATIFVLMGIIKASVFYSIFGINILEYAEWNEYLFFFLSDIKDIGILVLFFLASTYISSMLDEVSIKDADEAEKYEWIIQISVSLIFIVFSAGFFFNFTRRLIFSGILGIIIVYIMSFAGILLAVLFFKGKTYSMLEPEDIKVGEITPKGSNKILRYFIIISSLFLLVYIINVAPPYLKAYRIIKDTNKRKEILIYSKNVVIKKSSDSVLYVGKTNKFYFFFDLHAKKTSILNSSYVDSIQFTRKPFKGDYKYYDPIFY